MERGERSAAARGGLAAQGESVAGVAVVDARIPKCFTSGGEPAESL